MLSADERKEIEEEGARFTDRRAACVEALKVVQRRRGWVSDEELHDVAEFLDMTPAELEAVGTFYNMVYRRPVGRHVVLVCDSVSCFTLGCDGLLAKLREHLGVGPGQTSSDGRFTVLPIACLGTCDHAPALMVDGDLHQDVTPEALPDLLGRYP